MTGWGKEWNKPVNFTDDKLDMPKQPWPTDWPSQVPKEIKDAIVKGEFKDLPPLGDSKRNAIPTHDPYTNPGAYLYYECKCGQRLDPHTKRFAELNNAAMKAGWKIRWGANSYVPHCVECGRDME